MSASPLGQVFTPPELASVLVSLLKLDWTQPLSILDPAVGEGALLEALLSQRCAAKAASPGLHLAGLEWDPVALARARERLSGHGVSLNLWEGDALTCWEKLRGTWDAVIANPPYVAWHRIPPSMRERLERGHFSDCPLVGRLHHTDAQPDLSLFFLVLAVEALRPGGRLVFILPPEWLEARRVGGLRAWLLNRLEWLELYLLPPKVSLFSAGDQRYIQTNVMILVAQKSAHVLPAEVSMSSELSLDARLVKKRAQTAASNVSPESELCTLKWHRLLLDPALASDWRWVRDALRATFQRVDKKEKTPKTDVIQFQKVSAEQRIPRGASWPWRFPSSEAQGGALQRQQRLGGLSEWCQLQELPGVQIFGGHQPPVLWLEWLSWSCLEADAELMEVREHLYPATSQARHLMGRWLEPPQERWLLLPSSWSEAEFEQRAPHAYVRVRARAERVLGRQLPARWWIFPNRRNMQHWGDPAPSLLFSRTAPALCAAWDPWGRRVKGTNTTLRLDAHAPLSLEALWALLNSKVYAARVGGLPSYHGRGVRQEPQDIRGLSVPDPRTMRHQRGWSSLQLLAQRVLRGMDAETVLEPFLGRFLD